METKICSKCKVEKPLDEFYKSSKSNDGKRAQCKICEYERKRIYYLKNKDKLNIGSKQYNIDNKESIRKQRAIHHQDNKEVLNEISSAYYQNHKEHAYEYNKQYRIDNPEKFKIWCATQIAKRRGWGTPIILNEYFENSHCHHLHTIDNNTGEIDHRVCLYVPIEIHTSVWHSNKDRESMIAVNKLIFEWLLTQV